MSRLSRGLALGSVAAAALPAAWLALWPCIYRKSTFGGVGTACSGSLVAVNGSGSLVVLAIPVVLAIGGCTALLRGHRLPAAVLAGLLLLYCFVGIASIGLFFVPAFVLLAAACVPSPQGDTVTTATD